VVVAAAAAVVAATIVVNRVICRVTALKADRVAAAVVAVVVTVHVTTAGKPVTSHASVQPRWVEVEAVVNARIHESATIAMEADIYHVTVLSREKALTEAAWSATS